MTLLKTKNAALTVHVVDDEPAICDAIRMLLQSVNIDVARHDSAASFLAHANLESVGCLILDVRMPEVSGPELQAELTRRGFEVPVILMSAHANVRTAVRAIKNGAIDFLEKPFDDTDLLDLVQGALRYGRDRQRGQVKQDELRQSYAELTGREREVMLLIGEGLLSKEIAGRLSISVRTVENHRAHLMEKMGARSVADIVRMSIALDLIVP